MRILIAEDDPTLLRMFQITFEKEGWDVKTANNGEEAMEILGKDKVDFLMLDLLMPKKDGFQVLKEVRGNPNLQDLPVLVLSGLGSDEDIKKALGLGASDYFVKDQHPTGEAVERAKELIEKLDTKIRK